MSFPFPAFNFAVQFLFPFGIPSRDLAALVLGFDPIRLANASDIIGCFCLVAGLVGGPQIVIAVIAGKFPWNDVLDIPGFTDADLHLADMADAAMGLE